MEEVVNPETQTGAGFEPTRVRQFTVFLENRVGRLKSLVAAFDEGDSRIVALAVGASADCALVRLICSHPDAARSTLEQAGFSFSEADLLAVEFPSHERQPLIAICSALLAAEINIHYAYPLLMGPKGPTLALYVEDPILAARILIRKGFNLIGESDLEAGDDNGDA